MVDFTHPGFTGLYRGFFLSCGIAPVQALLTILTYERMKELEDAGSLAPLNSIVSLPYLAAAMVSIVTHPLDTLRKLAMASGLGNPGRYASMKPAAFIMATLKRENLIKVMMPGISMSVLRNAVWLSLIYGQNSEFGKTQEA